MKDNKAIYRVSGFDLPADSDPAKMLRWWKECGGTYKELFYRALMAYQEIGLFARGLDRMLAESSDEAES